MRPRVGRRDHAIRARTQPMSTVQDHRMAMASLVSLESPWSHGFDAPLVEWRRLFSEFLGTFLLVLAGAGGAMVDAASGGQIGRAAGGTAPGLLGIGVVPVRGAVSGGPPHSPGTVFFGAPGRLPR